MGAHLAGHTAPAPTRPAEDPRAYAGTGGAAAPAAATSPALEEPAPSAAGREGGGAVDAGAAGQAPPTAGGQEPRQNVALPTDDA